MVESTMKRMIGKSINRTEGDMEQEDRRPLTNQGEDEEEEEEEKGEGERKDYQSRRVVQETRKKKSGDNCSSSSSSSIPNITNSEFPNPLPHNYGSIHTPSSSRPLTTTTGPGVDLDGGTSGANGNTMGEERRGRSNSDSRLRPSHSQTGTAGQSVDRDYCHLFSGGGGRRGAEEGGGSSSVYKRMRSNEGRSMSFTRATSEGIGARQDSTGHLTCSPAVSLSSASKTASKLKMPTNMHFHSRDLRKELDMFSTQMLSRSGTLSGDDTLATVDTTHFRLSINSATHFFISNHFLNHKSVSVSIISTARVFPTCHYASKHFDFCKNELVPNDNFCMAIESNY